MYIGPTATYIKPDEGQSIKILKKLAAKYASFFDTEEQMYLEGLVRLKYGFEGLVRLK